MVKTAISHKLATSKEDYHSYCVLCCYHIQSHYGQLSVNYHVLGVHYLCQCYVFAFVSIWM